MVLNCEAFSKRRVVGGGANRTFPREQDLNSTPNICIYCENLSLYLNTFLKGECSPTAHALFQNKSEGGETGEWECLLKQQTPLCSMLYVAQSCAWQHLAGFSLINTTYLMLLFYLFICAGGSLIFVRHHSSLPERGFGKSLARYKSHILATQHTWEYLCKTELKFTAAVNICLINCACLDLLGLQWRRKE